MRKKVVILFYPSPWPEGERGRVPYASLYLERMLRFDDVEVILIDEQVSRDYCALVEPYLDRLLLASVSSMTGTQIVGGAKFSKWIKSKVDVPVVWGGWHPTLLPEQTLEEEYIDYVIQGQGENAIRGLVAALLEGRSPCDIPGLSSIRRGEFAINPPGAFIDINEFPDVDYSLIDFDNYVFSTFYAERCIGYFCSHGCLYECAFCCVAKVYGRKWYKKNVNQIIADLKVIKGSAEIDSVTFDDDNFFINRSFVIEFCEQILASGLDLKWDTSAHAGTFLKLFSDDDVRLMYEAGCRQIYIGAESGDQEILDLISKGTKVDHNIDFVRLLRRHGITPMLSTMVCFPVKNGKDIDLTIDMIRRAKLEDPSLRARMFFYTPYPGTELYDVALDSGFSPPKRLEGWPEHTLRKFKAPWSSSWDRWRIEVFANFYLPLSSVNYYRTVPAGKLKLVVMFVNWLFFPSAYMRMKFGFFKFPFEAYLFIQALRCFNRMFGTKFSLGYESYLD